MMTSHRHMFKVSEIHRRVMDDLRERQLQRDEPLREDKMRAGARIAQAGDEQIDRLLLRCAQLLCDDAEVAL